ncbi:MAG: hypothetical protein F8N37_09870, partial [Telmatospirillum sp.]|nr:hypothetical protein [Telmatospirillum sp.]
MAGEGTSLGASLATAWDTYRDYLSGKATLNDLISAGTGVVSALAPAFDQYPGIKTIGIGALGGVSAYTGYLSDSETFNSSTATVADKLAATFGLIADGAAAAGAIAAVTGQEEVAVPSAVLCLAMTGAKILVKNNADLINNTEDQVNKLLSYDAVPDAVSVPGDITGTSQPSSSAQDWPSGWTITYDPLDGSGLKTAPVYQTNQGTEFGFTYFTSPPNGSGSQSFVGSGNVRALTYTDGNSTVTYGVDSTGRPNGTGVAVLQGNDSSTITNLSNGNQITTAGTVDTGNLVPGQPVPVSTADGIYHVDSATGNITDPGAITTTVNGNTITIIPPTASDDNTTTPSTFAVIQITDASASSSTINIKLAPVTILINSTRLQEIDIQGTSIGVVLQDGIQIGTAKIYDGYSIYKYNDGSSSFATPDGTQVTVKNIIRIETDTEGHLQYILSDGSTHTTIDGKETAQTGANPLIALNANIANLVDDVRTTLGLSPNQTIDQQEQSLHNAGYAGLALLQVWENTNEQTVLNLITKLSNSLNYKTSEFNGSWLTNFIGSASSLVNAIKNPTPENIANISENFISIIDKTFGNDIKNIVPTVSVINSLVKFISDPSENSAINLSLSMGIMIAPEIFVPISLLMGFADFFDGFGIDKGCEIKGNKISVQVGEGFDRFTVSGNNNNIYVTGSDKVVAINGSGGHIEISNGTIFNNIPLNDDVNINNINNFKYSVTGSKNNSLDTIAPSVDYNNIGEIDINNTYTSSTTILRQSQNDIIISLKGGAEIKILNEKYTRNVAVVKFSFDKSSIDLSGSLTFTGTAGDDRLWGWGNGDT